MQTGKVLKRIFAEESSIEIGGFRISRVAHQEYNRDQRKTITVHYHRFESDDSACAPCVPCASSV
jgi:hypothetical protein